MTNGFQGIAHPEVEVSVQGEVLQFIPDDPRFQSGTILIEPKNPDDRITINSLTRGYGVPSYRGKLELFYDLFISGQSMAKNHLKVMWREA
jgi:hypothetical protein